MRTGMRIVVAIPAKGIEKIFESQRAAADYLGVDRYHIWQELNESRGRSRKLHRQGVLVMEYGEYEGLKPVRKHQIKAEGCFSGGKGQRVRMLDPYTHEILDEFESLHEAADDMGVNYVSSISRCCRGKMNVAHGFKWEYA